MLELKKPYLFFLGDVDDQNSAKTATGIAHWRPADTIGEFRYDDCRATTNLPRHQTLEAAVQAGAKTLVIGVANAGGFLADRWIETLHNALACGLDIASGMHVRLADDTRLRDQAMRHGRALHDVRVPPTDIPVGTGRPRCGQRVLTVGTDCSVGKMFTALAIERAMVDRGIDATFRATGQTGILIQGSGIAVDAVVADFISGATELLAPAATSDTHWDVIEGQGSLFHPSFAGVSLGLLHGAQAQALVLCHEPTRSHMRAVDHPLPDLRACIEANEAAASVTCEGARVVAISVNTQALESAAARACIEEIAEQTGLPTMDPVREPNAAVIDAILA